MITSASNSNQPLYPYILFHPKFLWKSEGKWWEFTTTKDVLEKSWWSGHSCFAIDVDCRKFPLLDVVNHGPAWTVWNLLNWGAWTKYRRLKVEYIFGEATQLTFEQARHEFVEYVCDRRWWSASYETEAQFRARNAAYTNMRDLMEPVSMKGKGP